MNFQIVRIDISNEFDIVLAHKHTMQITDFAGIGSIDQNRLATAIAEICRNCLEYAGGGQLTYSIEEKKGKHILCASISDNGDGIAPDTLSLIEKGIFQIRNGRGLGIAHAKKLTDSFSIESGPEGTTVVLRKNIPNRSNPINESSMQGLKDHFQTEIPVSPYEELKKRNSQLVILSEELKQKNILAGQQLEEIIRLNHELENKNSALNVSQTREIESEESFRFMAENIPNIIWRTDAEGRIDFINTQWTNYTGLSIEEAREEGWEKVLHPDDAADLAIRWNNALITGERMEMNMRIKAGDDNYYWFHSKIDPIKDAEGNIIMWIGTNTDIDDEIKSAAELERKVSERTMELSKAIEELRRSNQDLEQFAYVASHDLNEPIRMVSSYTKLLAKRFGKQMGAEADEFIHFISEGAERMQALIKDLLAYSRVGKQDLNLNEVDLNRVLVEVEKNLHEKIDINAAEIHYKQLPTIPGLGNTLIQLFQNLIENSLKFRGENCPIIEIDFTRENDNWLFKISDNGIGMDQQYADKIFVIFQRLHTRDKYEGTGMGLAIVKKIVELHNGSIWLESELGKGTTFYIKLPAEKQMISN
jgi:PAS domain S-box-containing protein